MLLYFEDSVGDIIKMKKIISVLLLMCISFCLVACGASNNASAVSDKSAASPAASSTASGAAPAEASGTPAAPAETSAAAPTPAAASPAVDLQLLVDSLNEEEVAQRTETDSYVSIFEVGTAENTINYKIAMDLFEYVVILAEGGDAEAHNRFNLVLDSLPPLENSLENALRESMPEIKVDVYLMCGAYSDSVAAIVRNGAIIYDAVNGIGTAPTDVKPIIEPLEMTPELQAQLDEIKGALANGETPANGSVN